MITCTRRIQFCAGHRINRHESKCRNLHGHNYVALFTAEGVDAEQDALGRVIDFGVLKERLGTWIDDQWDHGFILGSDDAEGRAALAVMGAEQKLYVLPTNPTAENLARYLLEVIGPQQLGGTGVRLVKVELWETENCLATVELGATAFPVRL